MGAARLDLRRMPKVRFWKLFGSGTGEGFTPVPNTAVWGILSVWDDEATARRMTAEAPIYARWAQRAADVWSVFLAPTSVRGKWSGAAPFRPVTAAGDGPLAALTRATIRPSTLHRFWGQEPDISRAIGQDPNVLFKIGVGEVPWLQQVTFSIWPDAASMAAFARADGPHARAIRAVRDGGWFREELYARFGVLGTRGTWPGAERVPTDERVAA